MIKVMKFGGTSVGGVEALTRTAGIVSKGPEKRVVVVSAMSGVTNLLIDAINRTKGPKETILLLEEKHLTTASELLGKEALEAYKEDMRAKLHELEGLLSSDPEGDPFLHDKISSWGERLSAINLSHFLREMGTDAVAVCSEEAGIHAIGPPGFGSSDLEATSRDLPTRLMPILEAGKVPVVTGFYGINPEGKPLTFGRGGSDYSASVIAHAIEADLLEIWTDVDGFMTADPRIVPGARAIAEMNYCEAADLAYFGAKVLHPRTIEPVRRKSIPLKVRNTFNPDAAGTTIHNIRSRSSDLLRSVAVKSELSIVKVYSSEIAYRPQLVSRMLDCISGNGITTYAISTSLSTLAFLIPDMSVKKALAKLSEVEDQHLEKMEVKKNMSLICAVGDDLLETCGVSARIFNAVKDAKANVELISEGASDVALNFVVPSDRANNVVRRLHDEFIGDHDERLR